MKTQTLIYYPDHSVAARIDNYLYQPSKTIILNDVEYHNYNQYDELDHSGWLVRKIWLKD